MQTDPMQFVSNCVNWPKNDVDDGLVPLIDQCKDITRRTFLKYIDKVKLADLELNLGYDRDFHMCNDWHVSYHKSKWHGKTVYLFKHSAIEYVFAHS